MRFLKNRKIDLPEGPAIPLLGVNRGKPDFEKTHAPQHSL